jgi:hypothetical protein
VPWALRRERALGRQAEKRWTSARIVTSTVAAKTTAPSTCTMLSRLMLSLQEVLVGLPLSP